MSRDAGFQTKRLSRKQASIGALISAVIAALEVVFGWLYAGMGPFPWEIVVWTVVVAAAPLVVLVIVPHQAYSIL